MGRTSILKVILCSILASHLFLLGSGSPVEAKKIKDEKSIPEVTSPSPITASTAKNLNKEEAQNLNNAQTERPATKKREIADLSADNVDYAYDYDYYGGKSNYDDDSYQAIRPYFENFRNDNPELDSDGYKGIDYRHYIEARRKRMARFNNPEVYYNSRTQPSRQELIYRENPLQSEPALNRILMGRWMRPNYPMDVLDPEVESDNIYNERQPNYFDRLDDQRFQNLGYDPTNDQFMVRRVRRSDLTKPGLYIPVLRRALL